MARSLESKSLLHGAVVLALIASAYGAQGCGSDSTSAIPLPGLGGFGGFGGFGFGGGGVTGNGGAQQGAGGSVGVSGSTGAGGAAGTPAGGAGGGAGATGTGGTAGAAGASGGAAGAAGGMGGGADGGTCVVPATLIDTSVFPACDKKAFPACSNGVCVPTSAVPMDAQSLLADCDAMNKCVPKYFVERAAKFIPPTCKSVNDAEGRCLSTCIPQIADQANLLQKATCADGELCAPCYDPRTGKDTGACTQGCDTGPKEAPKPFTKCCGMRGSCVPTSLVPTEQVSQLGKDTCTVKDQLCAPDALSDSTFKPKACESLAKAEGRCLPDCLPAVAQQASRLPKADCATGELCAPCYDPVTGKDTGACGLNGDKPVDKPVVFDPCCGTFGHCVPSSILTTDQKAQLGKDTCTVATDLCAPDVFSAVGQTPTACRALGASDFEGRCLPPCLPAVAAQKDKLDAGSCATGLLCVPCYDPITGASTSACNQNGDAPKDPKKTYPSCCGGVGACVPQALVPPAQVSQLGKDTCTASGALCAPTALIDPTAKPKTCTAPGNIEARCLPACLPAVQAQKANLRQVTCATNELCTPCYNPLDGTDTGACHINGDAPTKPKTTFAGCCPYPATDGTSRGTCVPPELVSASQATSLPQDSCATNFLCAPNLKVKDPTAKFKTCQVPLGSLVCLLGCTGGCVPDCIVADAQKPFLSQGSTCAAGELCAPCSVFGTSSGACD